MRVHSLRCSEMSIPGQPADQGGLSGGSSLWEPSEGKLHPIALTLFPSIHLLMPSGAQFAGSPSLQGCSTNILLVPLGNGSQCFLLATVSLKDPLVTLHTLATLTGYLGILRGLWIFPFSPETFHGLLSSFSLSVPEFEPFLGVTDVLGGCPFFSRCDARSLPCKKERAGASMRSRTFPLTVGKCDSLPGNYTGKRK